MKYPVIFKTFSVLFSLQSDERWIVPIFGGTIILLLAFSAWRLCTEKKDKWRYRRMMLLSLILSGVRFEGKSRSNEQKDNGNSNLAAERAFLRTPLRGAPICSTGAFSGGDLAS